jgi:hypothetical protein
VRLVYLDQNHWINLAKAAVGRPAGHPYRDALEVLREARRTGRAVIPLSLTHVMETSTIPRPQRGDVATVMEDLSGFTALISRAVLMRLELESTLDAMTESGPRKYNNMPIVAHGMA